MHEDIALVGAYGYHASAGLATLYRRDHSGSNRWVEVTAFHSQDIDPGDLFGHAVLEDKVAVVSAVVDSELFHDGDAAYVFYLGKGDDCNGNGVTDACDIGSGSSLDADGNGVPDECELGDVNGDQIINGIDLGILLASCGLTSRTACGGADPCPADLNQDGMVDGADLAIMLDHWNGP